MNGNLPFEILNRAFSHLSKEDKCQCLIVNKEWKQSALKSLYSHIALQSSWSMRSFLNLVAHHPQQVGRHVKKLVVNFHIKNNLTQFELERLARYCPNVQELGFRDAHCWRLLMQLDFTQYWRSLQTVPELDYRQQDNACILNGLRDRLRQLYLTNADLSRLIALPTLPHLHTLEVFANEKGFHERLFTTWHETAPSLQRIVIRHYPRYPDSHDTTDLATLQLKTRLRLHHLQLLTTHVYPSQLLRIVRQSYSRIDRFVFRWFDGSGAASIWTKRRTTQRMLSLLRHVQFLQFQLEILFTHDEGFVAHFFEELVHTYQCIDKNSPSVITVHFDLTIVSSSDSVKRLPVEQKCVSTTTDGRVRRKHAFEVVKRVVQEDGLDEVELLKNDVVPPITFYVEHLTFIMHYSPLRPDKTHTYRLDEMLAYFESLVVLDWQFPVETGRNILTVSDEYSAERTYPSLTTVMLSRVELVDDVCVFLARQCPNVTRVRLYKCTLDQNATQSLQKQSSKVKIECL
ncbi:MAG: hypothetical protein EXX96DRAFT_582974 [Benjaminiella poitrasii]|nr:MAG: hypothetical protein EXX96DRAFT_582974 [Benjaminiella poitrasii]